MAHLSLIAALLRGRVALSSSAIFEFDESTPTTYTFAGIATANTSDFVAAYEPTFTDYLGDALADYNISFVTTGYNVKDISLDAMYSIYGGVDFMLLDAGTYTCLDSLLGLQVVASRRNIVNGVETNKEGGVFIVNATYDGIQSIADLKNKKLALGMLNLGAGMMQEMRMQDEGVYVNYHPSQATFEWSEWGIVQDVLTGISDVGTVRTGTMEALVAGGYVDPSEYKIVLPLDVSADYPDFPYNTSTELRNEWVVVAMPHVPEDVAKLVGTALQQLNSSHPAAIAAGYSTFDAPYSYSGTKELMDPFSVIDDDGACVAFDVFKLYDQVQCPSGTMRINIYYLYNRCDMLGTPCNRNKICGCRYCVDVADERYPTTISGSDACIKMATCATAQQREEIQIVVEDAYATTYDSLSLNKTSRVEMHIVTSNGKTCLFPPGEEFDCSLSTLYGGSEAAVQDAYDAIRVNNQSLADNTTFYINTAISYEGLALVEVVVNGELVEASPAVVQVTTRDCDKVGAGLTATSDGRCECSWPSHERNGNCVQGLSVGAIVGICIAGVVSVAVLVVGARLYRQVAADSLWQIPAKALIWPNPAVVLGRGTYGKVLQADFRGTKVAVKQMHVGAAAVGAMTSGGSVGASMTTPGVSPVISSPHAAAKRLPWDQDGRNTSDASLKTPPVSPQATSKLLAASPEGKVRATDMVLKRSNMRTLVHQSAITARPDEENPSGVTASQGTGTTQQIGVIDRVGVASGTATGTTGPKSSSGGLARLPIFGAMQRRWKAERDFFAEIRVLSQLRHPNVTTVLGAVVEPGKPPLMVMECMDRGSLYDLLHNVTFTIEADMVIGFLKDVTCGMTFLHEGEILHNDIKSHNVLIDSHFRAKIADFGLASITKKARSSNSASKATTGGDETAKGPASSGPKGSGKAIGTPYWMAPELLRHETQTSASDVYAFGIVIYECLSRKEPYWEYDDPYEVLRKVADPARVDPDVFRPTVPENAPAELVQMMVEAWSASPQRRPGFREMMSRVDRVMCLHIESTIGGEDAISKRVKQRVRNRRGSCQGGALLTRAASLLDNEEAQEVGFISGLPQRWADALRLGRVMEQESFPMVCIVFTDIVGYSALSSKMQGEETVDMLDRLYDAFDKILQRQGMYNVDIIGDAYIAVSGLLGEEPVEQVEKVCTWCIEAIRAANSLPVCPRLPELGNISIRAGVHAGPVAAGVVGKLRPRFSLFGDTVNVAARMESLSRENCVQLSSQTADVLLDKAAGGTLAKGLRSRGEIAVKGKGKLSTYFLLFEGCQDPFALHDHDMAGK